MAKRLYRSRSDRMIWGVCGGLAEYFDIDPTIVRLIAVLLLFAGGTGVLAYVILAIVVPQESSPANEPKEVIRENIQEMKATAKQLGQEIQATLASKEATSVETTKDRHRRHNILGIMLIIIGILFFLASFDLLWWLRWRYLWPLVLVIAGLLVIVGFRRK